MIVTGTGVGAAIENITPTRSSRVEGPGAWRISKLSTKTAETMCTVSEGSDARDPHLSDLEPAVERHEIGPASDLDLAAVGEAEQP